MRLLIHGQFNHIEHCFDWGCMPTCCLVQLPHKVMIYFVTHRMVLL